VEGIFDARLTYISINRNPYIERDIREQPTPVTTEIEDAMQRLCQYPRALARWASAAAFVWIA
jgi:hypothetical protein